MLKRLIEVALPLKEVSEQSAREKSIRHGHISTLASSGGHVGPLAACARRVVFASLIPDPDDPACPEHFRSLVNGGSQAETSSNRKTETARRLRIPLAIGVWSLLSIWYAGTTRTIQRIWTWPGTLDRCRSQVSTSRLLKTSVPKVLDPFAGGGTFHSKLFDSVYLHSQLT